MKNRMIVVTDLGNFKAFKLDENRFNSSPRLELVEEFNTIAAHAKLTDQTTDQAGRFPRATGPHATSEMSAGERHNIELEQRRRLIKQLAERISSLIVNPEVDGCYFAAAKEINNMILDELAPGARSKIEKNLSSNLTKVEKSDLMRHFRD